MDAAVAYETKRLDHLGIVAGICQEIGLAEIIDAQVGPSERQVSVGQATQAMVLNGLGFSSRALYLTPEFFANKPVEALIGPGITAAMLHDDTLGRALEALYAGGVTELFARVAAAGCRRYGIAHEFVHLDSTSFHLHGAYDAAEPEREAIQITYGYSKDERPDLKQVVVNLMTSYRTAMPIWLEVLSGNSSDRQSFVASIEAYTAQLAAADSPTFVADSALYSADNLQALSSLRWVSRVPQTIRLAQEWVEQVAVEEMTPLDDAGYLGRELAATTARWPSAGWSSTPRRLPRARRGPSPASWPGSGPRPRSSCASCSNRRSPARPTAGKRWTGSPSAGATIGRRSTSNPSTAILIPVGLPRAPPPTWSATAWSARWSKTRPPWKRRRAGGQVHHRHQRAGPRSACHRRPCCRSTRRRPCRSSAASAS